MSELYKLGQVKVESQLVDLAYQMTTVKVGEKEVQVGIVSFQLKKPIEPGEETRDIVKLIKAFIKEFMPKHEITVLSGRGPIWLYAMLVHELAHVSRGLAIFDPKIEGAVIVAAHYYDIPQEGEVITLPENIVKSLTQ